MTKFLRSASIGIAGALGVLLALTALPRAASAQQILMDRGVRAAGLWCFPLANNPGEYLYLPSSAHLGVDRSGGPEFSFLRYVQNVKSTAETSSTITEAIGGGLLHFLALYETPEAQVARAKKALEDITGNKQVKLRGPLIFSAGRYAVISSVAQVDAPPGSPEGARKMIAAGNAPVLEGNKIALSMGLEKREAQILYNSFQMANPDVSIVFDMQFEGVADAYEATLDVDWKEVFKDQQFKAGGKYYWIGADIDLAFQRLRRNNAIKLVSRGENASSEALLNTVYAKLLELLFRPIDEAPPPRQEMGMVESLKTALGSGEGGGGMSSLAPFGLNASYRLKDIQSSGHTVLNFNHQAVVQRHSLIAFNVGNLFKRYGTNPDYFKAINLADPIYSQREVLVSADGSLLNDFDKYINNFSVTVKKEHDNGTSTLGEVVIDRTTFTQNANRFSVEYGWDGDRDRVKWLNYQYRTKWSFRDGGTYEEDWKESNGPMINVMPPYERRQISVEGDGAAMQKAGVKYAVVKIAYSFFGKPQNKQIVAKLQGAPIQEKLDIIQPTGDYKYQYEVRWHMNDGRDIVKPLASDASGIIFVDELP
jgi:hypothetical protein